MSLSDTGLLVRYPFKDAASGTAPTFVEDVGPNGYDLTDLNYGSGNLAFSEPATNQRGLTSTSNTGTQRANYPIGSSGDAVRTAVSGATQLTWELVVNYTSGSDSTGRLAAIQHRTSGASPAFGLTVVGTTLTPFINSTSGAATANLSASGRVVVHLVYDSTQAADADRLKLYVNGTLNSFSGSGIDLNEAIAIVGDHDIVHFNRNSGGNYDRSITGTIHYSALYSGAFSSTRVSDHYDVLILNDDTFGGGAVTHDATGTLSNAGASLAGSASSATTRSASGVLSGGGGDINGTAARTRVHPSSGVLANAGGTLSGSASSATTRTASGVLAGAGGVLAGSAERIAPGGTHDSTGALQGAGGDLDGSANRSRAFASSGVLLGAGGQIVGSAQRVGAPVTHDSSGALSGAGAQINAIAVNGTPRKRGGGNGRIQGKKGYIIQGKRYYLNQNELAVMLAQMMKEVKRSSVQEIRGDKPANLSRKSWAELKQTLARLNDLTAPKVEESDDDDEDILMLL